MNKILHILSQMPSVIKGNIIISTNCILTKQWRKGLFAGGILLFSLNLLSQTYTSKDSQKTSLNWLTTSTWIGGIAPSQNLTSENVTIKGYVTLNGSLVLNGPGLLLIQDTLVITGDLNMNVAATTLLQVGVGGVLIVKGNYDSKNKVIVENGGNVIIGGTIKSTGSQATYTGDPGSAIYAIGGIAPGGAYSLATCATSGPGCISTGAQLSQTPIGQFFSSLTSNYSLSANATCLPNPLLLSYNPVPANGIITNIKWFRDGAALWQTNVTSITDYSGAGTFSSSYTLISDGSTYWVKNIAILGTTGTITGNSSVLAGSSNNYSIGAVANATYYNWTVPAGSIITSGQGTTNITVTAGTQVGDITVTPSNGNSLGCIASYTVNIKDASCDCSTTGSYWSKNNYTGLWSDPNSWGNQNVVWNPNPPSTTGLGSGSGNSMCISGTITVNGDLTFTGGTKTICDTLIVTGNVTDNSSTITVTSTGVLIVLGNFNGTGGNLQLQGNGKIVINQGFSLGSFGYTQDAASSIYDFGAISGPNANKVTPTGTSLASLQTKDLSLYNTFINALCGSGINGGSVGTNQIICSGADVAAFTSIADASPSGSITYQWFYSTNSADPASGTWNPISGATGNTYDQGTLTQTTYFYRNALKGGSCTANSNVITITVKARPTSTVSGTAAVCNGNTATIAVALTGTPNWNLTYSDGSSSTLINGITTSPYTFNVSSTAKTYTVTALSDASGCSPIAADMTGNAAITVKSRPTSAVSGAATICKGGSSNINIGLTGTSPWGLTYSDGTTSTPITGITSSPYTLSVSPSSNATYTVTALNDANCNAQSADMTGSAAITVNTRPTGVISGTATLCNGNSTTLSVLFTGSGPWNLTYSDGTTSTSVTNVNTNPYTFSVSPVATKTYTLTALSDAKCNAIAADMTGSATVTANNPPSASILSGTATICNGNSTNLTIAITGGASPYNVILNDASTTSGYVSGANISKTPGTSTTYTLTSVQDANGCYSSGLSGNAIITVITTPALPSVITPGSAIACLSSTNTYSVTNDPVVTTYNWTYTGSGATLTPSGNSVSIAYGASATSGTLRLSATNACGTSAMQTLAITVNPNVTPSVSIAVSPTGTICYGTTLTYTATPANGGTPSYQWFLNSTPVGTNTNTWSANYILGSDAIKCVMTSSLCSNAGTNPATSNSITSVINKDVINLTSVSSTSLCAGSAINVNFTTPCAFTNTPANTFIAQLSNASGSFTSPTTIGTLATYAAGIYTINATIPLATATGTGYLIRVISSNAPTTGISGSSAAITINSSTGTPIAAATFGSGVWNVFCYSGNAGYGIASGASSPGSVNAYLGYYTENNLSFDTRNRWASGTSPITTNTTSGSIYIGCTSMPATNIYLSFKRTNIPCGNYSIDIPYHDDAYELYIDGVQVATHSGCCDAHAGVWTGWIGPSNKIEIRLFQGGGGSGIQATFNSNTLLTVSPNPTVCSGTSTTLIASGGGSSVTYSWSPSTFLNTTSGATVISTPTATTAYTVSATDISSGCATTANVTVTVSPTMTLAIAASPTTTTCMGITSTTLTATGANTYSWSPSTGLSATTGASVIASPGVNTTYVVTGNNGCTTATKSIAITGQTPGVIDSTQFGSGQWTVLCHDTTNYTKLYGYYTETGSSPNGLSFNTTTKWNTNNGPTVGNASYSGCAIPGINYSLRFKRTGVTCGYYSLTVNYQDDAASFWVNGVMVWSNAAYTNTSQPNVWTGFIGPSSKLEFRLINNAGPGRLQVTFTPITGIPNLSSPTTVCAGTSTTLTTGTFPGATYTWSSTTGNNSWISPVSGISTVITPPSSTPSGNQYFVRTLTDGTTGCSVKDSVLVTVNPLSNTSVTPSDTTVYCSTATVKFTASGASTYSWSPATGLSATTGSVVNATPGVTTTYTVTGNNNCNTKDATAKITVVPLVTDNTFPTGKWNVYGYNSTNWTNYSGYYTTNGSGTTGYDFNTQTQWTLAQGPSNATATGGTAYSGCSFGVDNFTTSFKRTGLACNYYQIDMVFQDDGAELWIDGVKVWANPTYTSTVQTNIWSGYLTTTSTVEFRQKEGGGGAGLAVKFTTKAPTFSSITVSPAIGICAGGSTSATLTAAAVGAGNTYTWSPAAGLSSTTGATTTALPAATTKYYVRVSNCSGSVYGDTAITVTVLQPSIINTHPAPQSVCENSNASFSIASSNTTSYQWEYSINGGTSWSNVIDGGIYTGATTQTLALTNVTFTYNTYKYRCRTTNGACSTVFSNDALLTVNQTPANPTVITGTATLCQNVTGVAYSVPAVTRATSYTWTLPAGATIATGSGTNSITVNFGTTSGNITVAGTNSCGNSATAATFAVTVNNGVPSDPGTITGTSSVCINTSGFTYTVPAVTGAATYTWSVPTGATITAGSNTNTITVSYGPSAASGNITVVGVNPCGTSVSASSLFITVNSAKPGNPVVITGNNAVCSNTSSNYSLGIVTGATSYTWTYPSGSSITSGAGTNNITILFGTTSGNITGAGTNGCGSSTIPATLAVSVSSPLASSPGTITGSNSVCQSASGITYSVASLTGATSYTWSVPSGASITSGSNTNSIITSYGASAASGNVTVFGTNICGNSPTSTLPVTLNSGIPNNPGSIAGQAIACKNATGIAYSIGAVTGATSYTWTLPTGSSIATGTSTNNITVTFGTTAGNINVIGVNGCGISLTPSSFSITLVNAAPSQPAAFTTSTASVCVGTLNVAYTVPNDVNATSYTWSYSGTGATFASTSNTVTISFGATATSGTLSVTATNTCGTSIARSLVVTANPLPTTGPVYRKPNN